MPKWSGSKKQIETAANYAVKRNTAASGQEMYARVYISIERDMDYRGKKLQQETLMNWPRMKQGLDTIITHYPSGENINRYAYLACQHNDQQQAAKLFTRIANYEKASWPLDKDSYYYCKAFSENRSAENLRIVQTYGSADPIAQQKYIAYEAAYQAYRKKVNAGDYQFNPHDADEYERLKQEYEKAAGR